MATADVLFTSPARMAPDDSVVVISSSPEFPSICDLLAKPARRISLRSGSNAAPIPDDAPTAFTSAANVWRSGRLEDEVSTGALEPQPSESCGSGKSPIVAAIQLPGDPARENRGSKSTGGERKETATATARRKKKAEQSASRIATEEPVSEVPVADIPPPKKPGRKAKSAKDPTMAQATLAKGKVTKPAATETKPKKKTETISRHFSAPEPPKLVADPMEDEPLDLEAAMRRRLDWTPPRPSAPSHPAAVSSATKERSSSAGTNAGGGGLPQRVLFKNLLDTYGRKADDVDAQISDTASISANPDVLGKRKLIEMVSTTGNQQVTPETSPTKPKSLKKRPRTITELATAAYRLPEEDDIETTTDEPKQDSLLGYLGPAGGQATVANGVSGGKAKGTKKPAKPKPPKPKSSKKKGEGSKQVLLSPTSAIRQVAKQDFVFGTASQLATEDDPELLRALHEAMRISNQTDSDPFASPSPGNSKLAIRTRLGAGLWTAGARDDDGDLLDLEVLDLTHSSPLPHDYLLPKHPLARGEAAVQLPRDDKVCIEIPSSDDALDLAESSAMALLKPLSPQQQEQASQKRIRLENPTPIINERDQLPVAAIGLDFEPPPSNQEHNQLLQSQSSSPLQTRPEVLPRPNFELYTDARLAKEVASYGFKPMKTRKAMISLLDKCWASKIKTSLGSRTMHASMSTSSAKEASSQPRGRPTKSSAKSKPGAAKSPMTSRTSRRGKKDSVSAVESEMEAPQAEKRPRGRPRKNAAASPVKPSDAKAPAASRRAWSPTTSRSVSPAPTTPRRRKSPAKPVVEVADSDSEGALASSAASSPEKYDIFSSPLQMDLSVTEDTETSLMASPTSQQVALFRYITQAVVSAPRTTDPTNPSWHEKMLMYDPIILEDLTAWLNSGQLDRVGYDGEVSPGDVKRWCESKSVCCLWRVNLNGNERKRF
ncbi:hypothetical protein VTK56DRAFT_6098 [Thermocarpiscus australiensis]